MREGMTAIADMCGDDGPGPFSDEGRRAWADALRSAMAMHREMRSDALTRSPFSAEWHRLRDARLPSSGPYEPPPWRREDW